MIVGFKGEKEKLKKLYEALGLIDKKANNFEGLTKLIKEEEKVVIVDYDDVMVLDSITADEVEKRNTILKLISSTKKNLYFGMMKNDTGLAKVSLDVAIETSVNTKDMSVIQDLFIFTNTDIAYNGSLKEDEYVLKLASDERGKLVNIDELKKIIK